MVKQSYTVKDKAGLHARPASILSSIASKYSGDVFILYNQKRLTLKSIMIVMSLGIPCGATFEIEVSGEDEQDLINQFTEVLTEHQII